MQIFLIGIPQILEKEFRSAIRSAVDIFYGKVGVGFRQPLVLAVLYDPLYQFPSRTLMQGYPLVSRDKITLILHAPLLLFQQSSSKSRQQIVMQTVVHELTHIARGDLEGKNVFSSIIDEGVATFVESSLVATPWYITRRTVSLASARKLWVRLQPMFEKSIDSLMGSSRVTGAIPTSVYQLGFFIVDEFRKQHQGLTYRGLIKVPTVQFLKFAQFFFNQDSN